jgi:hypothetical protein
MPNNNDKPEWVDAFAEALACKLEKHRGPRPPVASQVQRWIALVIALGGLAFLVKAGQSIGEIETMVVNNGIRASKAAEALEDHVHRSDQVHRDISNILRLHEARTAHLEGRVSK